MSEDPGAVAPAEETPQQDAQQDGRRGRPRPQATIERDDLVKAALATGAKSRAQLAEDLGWESKQVYASLWRLRHYGGQVRKIDGKSEWELVSA